MDVEGCGKSSMDPALALAGVAQTAAGHEAWPGAMLDQLTDHHKGTSQ